MARYRMYRNAGDRVGAIYGVKDEKCEFFGYGSLVGDISILDKQYPEPKGMFSGIRERAKEYGADWDLWNPLIKLDDGGYVWGCECWWSSADEIERILSTMVEVEIVDMTKFRADSE